MASELMKYIGKRGMLNCEKSLQVTVKILDAKQAYGQLLLNVHPENGNGNVWVAANRVTSISDPAVQS